MSTKVTPHGLFFHILLVSAGVFFFWRRIFSAVKSDATSVAVPDMERTSTVSAFCSSSFFFLTLQRRFLGHRCVAPRGLETSQRACCGNFPCSSGPQGDLWRFQRSKLLSLTAKFPRRSHIPLVRFFHDDGIYEDIEWWRSWDGAWVCGLRRRPCWDWVSWNFDMYIFMLSRSNGRALTASQSRGGDGNGSSPVVLSGRTQPAGANVR